MSEFEFVDRGYGKNHVKLMYINRQGSYHSIQELEVDTQLTLDTDKDYIHGDNSDVVATDTQKNTVYLLAKKHGVRFPEQFGLVLAEHFLKTYPHVNRVRVNIEQYPWRKLQKTGIEHNHAFIWSPECTRFSIITQHRGGKPQVSAGLKDLRVLKTTQSAFVNFHDDEYRSLPDTTDRVFSTIVFAKWDYSTVLGLDFCGTWEKVKESILENFAGDPNTGIFSPSVQNSIYITQKDILHKIPQISAVEMVMPNKHYFNVDFSKFRKIGYSTNNEVFQPVDKPSGNITAKLARRSLSKL